MPLDSHCEKRLILTPGAGMKVLIGILIRLTAAVWSFTNLIDYL